MSVKAFELVPVIECVKIKSDEAKTQIECFDVCGKNIYIGTNDCFVVHYSFEQCCDQHGSAIFKTQRLGHRYLIVRKPVKQIRSALTLNRIMVLCDSTFTVLNMMDLEPMIGVRINGVGCFCINEYSSVSDPFSVEVCVALKKKTIQLYLVSQDKLTHLRDFSVPDPAVALGLDGIHICSALTSGYFMLNTQTKHIQQLFPCRMDDVRAIIKRVEKEEFLLNSPSALGIFATSAGNSNRPPITWSVNLISVGYAHPYILAMDDEFITVHSILDMQQKQAIAFQGGVLLDDFNGSVFVATSQRVYVLLPLSLHSQLQSLMEDKRVVEALELVKNSTHMGMTSEKVDQVNSMFGSQRDHRMVGIMYNLKVIDIFPGLMPDTSDFSRASPALHDIDSIPVLANHNSSVIMEYKSFLRIYLEELREFEAAGLPKKEVDIALLKLYAEAISPELIALVSMDTGGNLVGCYDWLSACECFHALALLYERHREYKKALGIWTKLVDGDLIDDSFPGLEFVVKRLTQLADHGLVMEYLDWALEVDEEVGIRMLTERSEYEPLPEQFRPDFVIKCLHRFPVAIVKYLEYIVFVRKIEKEVYHTHLASLYLDTVLHLKQKSDATTEEVESARSDLRHLLQTSNLYRAQMILARVNAHDLHAEGVILYGKLGEHEKALRLVVHRLKDYDAAENYCLENSGEDDSVKRKQLFHILLSIYLDQSYKRKDTLIAPAVALLNGGTAEFDSVQVLRMLPDNWSLALVTRFLTHAICESMHSVRTRHVHRALSEADNLHCRQAAAEFHRKPIVMTEDRLCSVCRRSFNDPIFMSHPSGVVTHIHCAKNKLR